MDGDSTGYVDDIPYSASALSNQLGNICDRYDAIAVYGPIAGERSLQPNASQRAGLGSEGVPLLFGDHRSPYRLAQKHLLTHERVSRLTDFIAKPEADPHEAGGFSSTKSAFHWSADEATLELRRIEIGAKDRGVWIVHDINNDESDFSGVQIKKDW